MSLSFIKNQADGTTFTDLGGAPFTPKGTTISLHYERVWVTGNRVEPYMVYFSKDMNPEFWDKTDPSACSVFIDAETHRVLVIVQGATGEIAEKVIKKYPSAVLVSRDRGTAYASAAKKHGKEQVADGFHLVQNIHQTIKDALSLEFGQDLFIREGEGWIRMVDSASEKTNPDYSEQDNNQGLVVIKPALLSADDIERRIQLAGLNQRQTQKYKKTMAILELSESGLRLRKGWR